MKKRYDVLSFITAFICAILLSSTVFALPDPPPGTLKGAITVIPDVVSGDVNGINAIATQADRKIVLAGACGSTNIRKFCAFRLNENLTLDTSFNSTGKTVIDFPFLVGDRFEANAVAIQSDGKIVLGGFCESGFSSATTRLMCAVRLNTNGSLDTSFNTVGAIFRSIGAGDYDEIRALAIQANGRIVFTGRCENASGRYDFCTLRYLANGTSDSSFNGTGVVVTANPSSLYSNFANAVAIQPDGKVAIGGTCADSTGSFLCLARYTASGTLDSAFNGTGIVNAALAGDRGAHKLAIQPDGRILYGRGFGVFRVLPGGSDDTRYGIGGSIDHPLGTVTNTNFTQLALQPDGKAVLLNQSELVRVHQDGRLDTAFGSAGRAPTPFTNTSLNAALAIEESGHILVAGRCTSGGQTGACIARSQGGPFGAQNCKPDLDGDGRFTATDALINLRVSFGMTGLAVTDDLSFIAGSSRTSWEQIREYLNGYCGMNLER